jgi:hypothetical protein
VGKLKGVDVAVVVDLFLGGYHGFCFFGHWVNIKMVRNVN